MRTFLPMSYLQGFAAPEGRLPVVWVLRPEIGEWKPSPLAPDGPGRHFNVAEDPDLEKAGDLEERLGTIEGEANRIVQALLEKRASLPQAERSVLAEWLALMAIRLSSRFNALDEAEARRGYEELVPILREMGWVLWEATPPAYFITSNSPFHVAFPKPEQFSAAGHDLQSPGVEITMPLSARLALHATWKRTGELWRGANEDALMELNGRTAMRARRFLAAHKPAIPG